MAGEMTRIIFCGSRDWTDREMPAAIRRRVVRRRACKQNGRPAEANRPKRKVLAGDLFYSFPQRIRFARIAKARRFSTRSASDVVNVPASYPARSARRTSPDC
jgi:hypothetical protein